MRRLTHVLLLIVVFASAALVFAISAADAPAAQGPIRVQVDRVAVVFSALDRKGRFVTDLAPSDIRVYDNRQPQQVIDFIREMDLPLRIGLLIDASSSVRDRFKFEQEAAIEFLQSVLRRETDQAFVLSFDTNVEVVHDFTNDVDKLRAAIVSLRAGGGTALYDAIYHAARDKMVNVNTAGVRRTVVVLSDGEDNQSRVSREEALEMAQRAETTIYAISTNTGQTARHGDKILTRFAEETGGRVFYPFKISDLSSSFEQITEELRSQYALLYRPSTPQDGSFHTIRVEPLRRDVRIRARKGYYAKRE